MENIMKQNNQDIDNSMRRVAEQTLQVVNDVLAKHNVSIPSIQPDSPSRQTVLDNIASRLSNELEGRHDTDFSSATKMAAYAALSVARDPIQDRKQELLTTVVGNETDPEKQTELIRAYMEKEPDSEYIRILDADGELAWQDEAVDTIESKISENNIVSLSANENEAQRSSLTNQVAEELNELANNNDYVNNDYVNDMLDMEDSIHDSKTYMDNEYDKFNGLLPDYADILSAGNAAIVDTGIEPRVDSHILSNEELREAMKQEAPFQYMAAVTKDAINDVKEAVGNVFKVETTRAAKMLEEISLVKVLDKNKNNILSPVIESGVTLVNNMNKELTALTGGLYQRAAENLENTNEMIDEFKASTMQGINHAMEVVTGGRWSQYQAIQEVSHASEVFAQRDKAVSFLTKHFGAPIKDSFTCDEKGVVKQKYELNTFGKLATSVVNKIAAVQLKGTYDFYNKKNITQDLDSYVNARASYWAALKNDIWKGEKSPAEKVDDWVAKTAVEFGKKTDEVRDAIEEKLGEVVQDFHKANAFVIKESTSLECQIALKAAEFATAVQNVPSKVKSGFGQFMFKTSEKANHMAMNVRAEAYNISGIAMEQISKILQKYANRIMNKVSQLETMDKRIFDSMENIKKEMHALTEVTPYKRPEFTPDPNIAQTIKALKDTMQEPGTDKNLAQSYIDVLQKKIDKDKAKFDRKQDKLESKADAALDKAKGEKSADFWELKTTQVDNKEKHDNALATFFKVNDIINKLNETAGEHLMQSIGIKREAADIKRETVQLDSRDENNSGDEYAD